QIVLLLERKVATLLLERAEARVVDLPRRGIARKERSEIRDRRPRVAAEDVGEAAHVFLRLRGEAGHPVALRPVGDVLVGPGAALAETEEERAVRLGNLDRRAREVEDPPLLEIALERRAARLRQVPDFFDRDDGHGANISPGPSRAPKRRRTAPVRR